MVVYLGRSKWKVGLEFQYLFDLPEALQGLLPDFRYLLCDLTQYRDEDIRGAVTLKVAFLLMKHIFSNDLVDRLPGILELLRDLIDNRNDQLSNFLFPPTEFLVQFPGQFRKDCNRSVKFKIAFNSVA